MGNLFHTEDTIPWEIRFKNNFLMVSKSSNSKYKVLARYKQPIWLEKKGKIVKFKRKKWEKIKSSYFQKKYKFFNQDVAAYSMTNPYESARSVRLKKTYKFLLQDKQRFQLYYGAGRLKYFRMKKFAINALRISKNKNLSPAKIFLHLFEKRLDVALYRLGFANSLMQARRLKNSGVVRLENITGSKKSISRLALQNQDFIAFDPAWHFNILARYLKANVPFFYFRNKKLRKEAIFQRQDVFHKSFFLRNRLMFLKLLRSQILELKTLQKNKT